MPRRLRTFSGRALRNKQLEGLKFKRQVPLDGYIVDFVCFEARLIIEVDGGQHSESERDVVRDRISEAKGFGRFGSGTTTWIGASTACA
jgi:very-short-patch-repair endonuclease